MSDPVIAMFGMPPAIPIQPVAHVQKLFAHDNFQRMGLRLVDPIQVDQYEMTRCPPMVHVGTADRCIDASPQPLLELRPARRDVERFPFQAKMTDVLFSQTAGFGIANRRNRGQTGILVDVPAHELEVPHYNRSMTCFVAIHQLTGRAN